ncbi:hypothetical protein B0H13DRAFT_2277817 [Mycena leptocephala]|nr:hypothetical protein B0H13DRAFT_2277817 [Mycena leptocephala]
MTNARTRACCSHGDLRGACRRIQTKGQKTELVRIVFADRDRQNGKECASGAMKGRCAKGIRKYRTAGTKPGGHGIEELIQGSKEEDRMGWANQREDTIAGEQYRQESSMLYQYFETRVGVGIEKKAGWEIEVVERDVAFGARLRGDRSAGGENKSKERKVSIASIRKIELQNFTEKGRASYDERTDSIALSIYRQINGPNLDDTSSVLLLVRLASSSSAGGKRREWGRGLVLFWISEVPDCRSATHRLLPSLLLVFYPIQRLNARGSTPLTPSLPMDIPATDPRGGRTGHIRSAACPRPELRPCPPRGDPDLDRVQFHFCSRCNARPPASPSLSSCGSSIPPQYHISTGFHPISVSGPLCLGFDYPRFGLISSVDLAPTRTATEQDLDARRCFLSVFLSLFCALCAVEEISLPLPTPLHPQVLVARPWQPLFALLSRLLGSAPPGDSLPTPSELESRLLSLAIHQTSDFRLRPISSTRTQCDPHVTFISSCGLDNTDHFQGYPSCLSSCPMLSDPISLI